MTNGYRHDRRRFQRLKTNLFVVYRIKSPLYLMHLLGDREFEATTLDISQNGMAFLADRYLPVATKIVMEFILFDLDHSGIVSFSDPFKVAGDVRSCVESGSHHHRIGMRFENLTPHDKAALTEFMCSTLRPAIIC